MSATDRRGVHLRIADEIKDKIRTGELNVGDQLPSENALAGLYGVSRTTAQKARAVLVAEGYITTIQGQGAYVAPPRPAADSPNHTEMVAQLGALAEELQGMAKRLAHLQALMEQAEGAGS